MNLSAKIRLHHSNRSFDFGFEPKIIGHVRAAGGFAEAAAGIRKPAVELITKRDVFAGRRHHKSAIGIFVFYRFVLPQKQSDRLQAVDLVARYLDDR